MSLYDRRTDPALESDGVRFEHKETKDTGYAYTIRRAHAGNKKYSRAMTRALAPYRRQIDNDEADDDLIRGPLTAVYVDFIIVKWETMAAGVWQDGIQDETGEIVPATKDVLFKVLTDLPETFDQIREDSTKAAFYRAQFREGDAKN